LQVLETAKLVWVNVLQLGFWEMPFFLAAAEVFATTLGFVFGDVLVRFIDGF